MRFITNWRKKELLQLSKICDSADWFDSEFNSIVINELKEQPRLHRKQWEFAMIFLALQRLGFLDKNKTGLSMGGGTERVLYSIANHVNKLFVTDLYEENTSWDCARTVDPDKLIKSNMPFEVADDKITALKMDMRSLDFEDETFDFCYSSCAFEHIGSFDDFVQHLNEVYRCLKNNGVYVFTTELQLGNTTIQDKNNYIFSSKTLQLILNNVELSVEINPDITLTDITTNYPLPSNVSRLCSGESNSVKEKLMNDYPHTILLRGRYPFTSLQLVLRKKEKDTKDRGLYFLEFEQTKSLVAKGVDRYRSIIENSKLNFAPFSSLPEGISHYYLDHSKYFSKNSNSNNDTIFHTDYFWLGNGIKHLCIKLEPSEIETGVENTIQLRIHRYATLNSEIVNCVFEKNIEVSELTAIYEIISFETDDDYCYAILAKSVTGKFSFRSIKLESSKAEIKEEMVQPI